MPWEPRRVAAESCDESTPGVIRLPLQSKLLVWGPFFASGLLCVVSVRGARKSALRVALSGNEFVKRVVVNRRLGQLVWLFTVELV